MLKRNEFSRAVKRQALERSGGYCEAVGGPYGLPTGARCNAPLMNKLEFDHYPIRASAGGSGQLDNCMAVCSTCHSWKTANHDAVNIAKERRVRDYHLGIGDEKAPFPGGRKTAYKKKLNGDVVKRARRSLPTARAPFHSADT